MIAHTSTKIIAIVLIIMLACIAMATASCGGKTSDSDKLGVAVTLVPYADFVRQVGGDRVDVTVMVPPGASPHSYEPTPAQMVALSNAEAYVKAGSGVEFELTWMNNLIAQNPGMLIVDSSQGIALLEGGHEHEEEEHEAEEHGDFDPHVWTSPANVKIIVENICDGFVAADPDNAAYYQSNRDSYLDELDDLDEYIRGKFEGYKVRYFLIYHPSFGYFAAEYDLTQLSIELEGKEPTPKVIQRCIDLAQQYNLDYVFIDPASVPQYAETIAGNIGGRTATLNPLPENYIDSMRTVADAIALELE
ncbi:MAG: zinc ABC transporter substrate-binding protein [Dehalococcoidia bacterium]|jgi:zinc transport system substrate-binding protein